MFATGREGYNPLIHCNYIGANSKADAEQKFLAIEEEKKKKRLVLKITHEQNKILALEIEKNSVQLDEE